jgi:predicted ATPase/class 3 adenylate cyclase
VNVSAWLHGIGLGRYERTFRENDIDADLLPSLTDKDLRELGVNSLGHRKQLLAAIAELTKVVQQNSSASAIPPEASIIPSAERRQLTVIFADLVDSTPLSRRLDPEEMSDVLRVYQNAVAGEITRMGGHIAKFMGDGVLAYFGWPKAHEDAAERAVRAGLGIVDAVAGLKSPGGESLAARTGIATGVVVVGEIIGSGEAQERTVVGATPNLAARLQGLAEPGTVLVAEATRKLLGDLFEFRDLGHQTVKGFPEPVHAYRALGMSRVQGRFESLRALGVGPLVGREAELNLLLSIWHRARSGKGQVVLLSGEPGIGKSRLILAFRERLRDEPIRSLRYHASVYHKTTAMWPVIDQLERAAGLLRNERPEDKLDKLEAVLQREIPELEMQVALLAHLLSIPTLERFPPVELTPQQRKARTLEILVAQIEQLARKRPLLVILEDAHWLDPTTIELFDLIIERVRHLPAMLVITFRPEFTPTWNEYPHVTRLTLSRLDAQQTAEVVTGVAHGQVLPLEIVERILAKTDGVPLFVEELTKTVLETGLLRAESGRYVLTAPLPNLAIPDSLQDSLLARLDRSEAAKEVAQVGAAIGRDFTKDLVVAVTRMSEERLNAALDELITSGLIHQEGRPPRYSYVFKHALVQEAAYGTLLKSKCRHLHTQIVRALEEKFPEILEQSPGLVAHHCTRAGLVGKAVDYLHRSGHHAVERSAMKEAVAQLETGIELLKSLPPGPERDRKELALQVTLGVALYSAQGQGAPATGAAYQRARHLAEGLGETQELFRILYGQAAHQITRAELSTAVETAETLIHLAQGRGDVSAQAIGHRIAGAAYMVAGNFTAALRELDQALSFPAPAQQRAVAVHYGQDPWASARAWIALPLLLSGKPSRALVQHQTGLVRARELGHPNTLAQVLFCGCVFQHLSSDVAGVQEQANALGSLASEQLFPFWSSMATIFQGWADARTGEPDRGIEKIERGLSAYRATSAAVWTPYFLTIAADGYQRKSDFDRATELLEEALGAVARTGERWNEAEIRRCKGEVLLQTSGLRDEAEVVLSHALQIARQQDGWLLEIRSALSLARLLARQKRFSEALGILASVTGPFDEGQTPETHERKRLADVLSRGLDGSLVCPLEAKG